MFTHGHMVALYQGIVNRKQANSVPIACAQWPVRKCCERMICCHRWVESAIDHLLVSLFFMLPFFFCYPTPFYAHRATLRTMCILWHRRGMSVSWLYDVDVAHVPNVGCVCDQHVEKLCPFVRKICFFFKFLHWNRSLAVSFQLRFINWSRPGDNSRKRMYVGDLWTS